MVVVGWKTHPTGGRIVIKHIFLIFVSSLILLADGWRVDIDTLDNITYGFSKKNNISLDLALSQIK